MKSLNNNYLKDLYQIHNDFSENILLFMTLSQYPTVFEIIL